MTRISVDASRSYTVTVGSGVLARIGQAVAGAQKVCIVSDRTVWQLYGKAVEKSCTDAGLTVCSFIVAPGERSKSWNTLLPVLDHLAENGLTRSDFIIALGGGVVGDLAGFAAATYLRGIPYIQVPTTLLAMVDSSVGGKTGIDLPAGKNLCGAFYQPWAVLCDTDALDTLPEEIFREGCAEVIKYAILFDPELFEQLESQSLRFDREAVISRCIIHKRDLVRGDEFDRGQRMLLNLGHTVGHSIEKCSNYRISHGQAVAIGLATVCRASKCRDTGRILALLEKFGLPTTTELPAEALWEAARSDKKRSGDLVQLILPLSIGRCEPVPMDIEQLKTFMEEGI